LATRSSYDKTYGFFVYFFQSCYLLDLQQSAQQMFFNLF